MPKKSITNQKITKSFFFVCGMIFIPLLNFSCSFPLRQFPVLENDQSFILLTKDALGEQSKPPEKRNYQKKVEELKTSISLDALNDRSVFLIRLARIEEAENILLSLVKKDPEKITPLLNLIRMYYILDEYDIIRDIFSEYYDRLKKSKNQAGLILTELRNRSRNEERVILLDVLSSKPGWEIKALEELGLYFFEIGNYENAETYFERILSTNSFHSKSLYNLALISLEKEKYSDTILYASNLIEEKSKEENLYYLLLKANYELGKYKDALKWADKAPDTEKTELEFLSTWKNAKLANDIYADLSPLKKYFFKLKKKGLKVEENSFFPTTDLEGKSLLRNIIHGR